MVKYLNKGIGLNPVASDKIMTGKYDTSLNNNHNFDFKYTDNKDEQIFN